MPIDPSIPLSGMAGQGQRQPMLSPFAAMDQFAQIQQRQMMARQEMLKAQELQRQQDDEAFIGQSMQRHATPEGDIDVPGVLYDLQSAGRGNAAIAFQTKAIDWRKAQATELMDKNNAMKVAYETAGRIARSVQTAANPQEAFARATPQITALVGPDITKTYWGSQYDKDRLDQVIEAGKSQADVHASLTLALEQANKALDRTATYLRDQATQAQNRPALVDHWRQVVSDYLSLPGVKTDQDWQAGLSTAAKMMGAVPDIRDEVLQGYAPHLSPQAKEDARLLGMTLAQRSEEQSRKDTAARLAEAEDVPMTPAAIDQAAQRYAYTGDMGAMGMGKTARNDRNTIKNRAAELYAGLNPAQQISAYQANKSSLAKQTATYDMIQAWENTGLKNARVFLQQAQKVVDSGSPWINEPLRKIDEKAFGSSNVATYNAARGIVTPEFAKLLQNAGAALGGTLTDTARAEVDALISGDFNYKQAYDVVKLFANDAENRRQSQLDQIRDIQGRLGATPIGVKVAAGDILPPTTPPPAAGSKTITEADIQKSMVANHWTHDQAVAEAKKRGYTVQ